MYCSMIDELQGWSGMELMNKTDSKIPRMQSFIPLDSAVMRNETRLGSAH